jgi:hypothetical protein
MPAIRQGLGATMHAIRRGPLAGCREKKAGEEPRAHYEYFIYAALPLVVTQRRLGPFETALRTTVPH